MIDDTRDLIAYRWNLTDQRKRMDRDQSNMIDQENYIIDGQAEYHRR